MSWGPLPSGPAVRVTARRLPPRPAPIKHMASGRSGSPAARACFGASDRGGRSSRPSDSTGSSRDRALAHRLGIAAASTRMRARVVDHASASVHSINRRTAYLCRHAGLGTRADLACDQAVESRGYIAADAAARMRGAALAEKTVWMTVALPDNSALDCARRGAAALRRARHQTRAQAQGDDGGEQRHPRQRPHPPLHVPLGLCPRKRGGPRRRPGHHRRLHFQPLRHFILLVYVLNCF